MKIAGHYWLNEYLWITKTNKMSYFAKVIPFHVYFLMVFVEKHWNNRLLLFCFLEKKFQFHDSDFIGRMFKLNTCYWFETE